MRDGEQESLVRATGAEVVVTADGSGLDAGGRFRAVIDGVGGEMLGRLIALLEPDGRAVLYGVSAGPHTPLAIRDLMLTGAGRVEGFYLYREAEIEAASKGLARLLALLADGRLKTLVAVTGGWETIGETAEKLIQRRFAGKAVLTI